MARQCSLHRAAAIDLKHSVQLMSHLDSGTIRLGLISAPAATFTATLMSRVLTQYPRVQLHFLKKSPDSQVALPRELGGDNG
jgi:hypothetical protein